MIDLRKPCGNNSSGTDDATRITAENMIVRPGGHHRSADRGLGVVALGDLLAEPADHEQAVVDGDAEAHQRHHRLGEEVHGRELGDQTHDAERARDGQAADDRGQGGGDDAAEHEEQHHATSGMAATSARFWSSPMVPVSSLASGCRPASLTSTPSIARP